VKRYDIFLLLVLVLFAVPVWASSIGSIKNVEGQAWIERGEEKISAGTGVRLQIDDILKTGNNGAMGIILHDDTIISMGPRSEMVVSEFVFKPEDGRFGLLAKFIKGTFSYLSGVMSKLAPESVKIETPVGMVAVRGTNFLVKVED
jgi:hypothetical protein